MQDGCALPSMQPGLGIEWDWKAIERKRNAAPIVIGTGVPSKAGKAASKAARQH
jgi:hypothetical protein